MDTVDILTTAINAYGKNRNKSMTNERIKELEEVLWKWLNLHPFEKARKKQISQLIRTIVTEARQDTIKELDNAGRLIPI